MKTKRCCECRLDLPLSEYCANKTKSDGLGTKCRSCQRAYSKQHYADNKAYYLARNEKRRQKWLAWWTEYKSSLRCRDCPENHPACLQFHHSNDDKEYNVSSLVGSMCSRTKILKEIAKCEVLCANCHFKRHYKPLV